MGPRQVSPLAHLLLRQACCQRCSSRVASSGPAAAAAAAADCSADATPCHLEAPSWSRAASTNPPPDGTHLAVNAGRISRHCVPPRSVTWAERGCSTSRSSRSCGPFHTVAAPRTRVPKGLSGLGLQQTAGVETPETASRSTDQPATRGPAQHQEGNRPEPAFGEPRMQLQRDVAKPAQRKTALMVQELEMEKPPVITQMPKEFPRDHYSYVDTLVRGERARYDVDEAKKRSTEPRVISLTMESRMVNLEISQRKTPKFAPNLEIIRSSTNTGLAASDTNPENFRRTDSEVRVVSNYYVWATLAFYVFASYGSYKVYQYKGMKERHRYEDERRWIDKLMDAEATGDDAAAELLMEERRRSMCNSDETSGQLDEGVVEADRQSAETFDTIAENYDKGIGKEEMAMGTNLIRRWMLSRHAKGDVLEVGSGTGRNFKYYKPKQVKSLTLVDRSSAMLQVAERKAMKRFGRNCLTKDSPTKLRVRTQLADAHELSDFADQSFDTVVSTFTLCSLADPVRALREMARVCKPDGRLIFLEHGRSGEENNPSWAPYLVTKYIDAQLDVSAERHRDKWGCTWNKNIAAIVAQAGLEVETETRWHFGTTYYIIAKPPLPYDFEYSERQKIHPALNDD